MLPQNVYADCNTVTVYKAHLIGIIVSESVLSNLLMITVDFGNEKIINEDMIWFRI